MGAVEYERVWTIYSNEYVSVYFPCICVIVVVGCCYHYHNDNEDENDDNNDDSDDRFMD